MLYLEVINNEVKSVSEKHVRGFQNRWDWKTLGTVEDLAVEVTKLTGKLHVGIDNGSNVSPRFDIIEAPIVGTVVSYTFNGDSYPCGKIIGISASLRCVRTDDGTVFWRRGRSGSWIHNRTWTMIEGRHNERNPSF